MPRKKFPQLKVLSCRPRNIPEGVSSGEEVHWTMPFMLDQRILTEGNEWLSTVDLLIKVVCSVTKVKKYFKCKKHLLWTCWYKEVNCTKTSTSVRVPWFDLFNIIIGCQDGESVRGESLKPSLDIFFFPMLGLNPWPWDNEGSVLPLFCQRWPGQYKLITYSSWQTKLLPLGKNCFVLKFWQKPDLFFSSSSLFNVVDTVKRMWARLPGTELTSD